MESIPVSHTRLKIPAQVYKYGLWKGVPGPVIITFGIPENNDDIYSRHELPIGTLDILSI